MRLLHKKTVLSVFAAAAILSASPVSAAETEAHFEKQEWSFNGIFGTYDRAALQRGYKIYAQVCATCHSAKQLYFRNLTGIGYDEAQVKAIAAQYTVTDGPNDEGEMFERPGRPSDHFPAPFANRQAAVYANNGAYPPDLSLIARARHGGADYIYGILTGYEPQPADSETVLRDGQYWNKTMAGHVIAMPPPLSDGIVAYEDNAPQTLQQYAKDISHFLVWAADPTMEARKRMGVKVCLFLIVFAGVVYAAKRKIWKDAH